MSSIFEPIRAKIFQQATTMVHGWLNDNQIPSTLRLGPAPIVKKQCYINIKLHSMHIVYNRIGFQRLYGVVHSFIKLRVYQIEEAQFNVVTTPDNLANIDGNRMDLVIQGNKELLDCVPYRGDTIQIQLGLFAVKSEDMIQQYLALLGELADAAGVDYVRQAVPFLGPITKGINLLLGVGGPSKMIVGMQDSMTPTTGYYVITNEPATNPNKLATLKMDQNYNLLNPDGTSYRFAYIVFSMFPTPNRDSWFDIPDLGKALESLLRAKKSGTEEAIKQAYDMFEKEVQSSPDLISEDSKTIAREIRAEYLGPLKETEKEEVPILPPTPTATSGLKKTENEIVLISPPTTTDYNKEIERMIQPLSPPTSTTTSGRTLFAPPRRQTLQNRPWVIRTLSEGDKKAFKDLKIFAEDDRKA